ncbi:cation:proton antiporter [Thermococcus chitonophagus]|uniref:Cation:proton antiporter n=1 Tax=Thermococcus chitonophagus TaxID=54262 RepID=A0A160VRX5_9EURY|nr:hydrogenase subunit MbhD domain-containing protein [Thermococcus chitonophagus]ASJ16696.1 cation:proton antiporter [Thermococcus chitonophagus]CUX77379.1 putative multisubunit Na+/H+ antiporter [Thermococcus chitonophagus]
MLGTILSLVIIGLALVVVLHRDFLASLITYGLVSLAFILLLLLLKAPDVALSAIVVGALVTGLFIFAYESTGESGKVELWKGIFLLPLLALFLRYKVEPRTFTYNAYISHWSMKNLVTEILAGWRLYDSIGEAMILFSAALGFSLILRRDRK